MRDVMGHFATGVSIVTARDGDGAPVGTTANAISSVSLDPPLLLACLARNSETLAAVRADGRFAVNILGDEQRHHSDRFAKKGEAVARPRGRVPRPRSRRADPAGALATIACEVEAIHPAGDHEIVIGHARHLEHRDPAREPLLFYRGPTRRLHDRGGRTCRLKKDTESIHKVVFFFLVRPRPPGDYTGRSRGRSSGPRAGRRAELLDLGTLRVAPADGRPTRSSTTTRRP